MLRHSKSRHKVLHSSEVGAEDEEEVGHRLIRLVQKGVHNYSTIQAKIVKGKPLLASEFKISRRHGNVDNVW